MKHGGLVFAGITLALLFAFVPLTAQQGSINYQTYMVDTFDNPDGQGWTYQPVGSKFITEGYPKIQYTEGMPHAVKVMNDDKENAKFIGIEFKFNRKGDNWVDIIPMKDGKPFEPVFKGNVHRLDMWVWGAGYYYDLEIIVRDCEGRTHTLSFGSVNFKGWKNLFVSVPKNIPQASRYLGNKNKMTFVAFRIRTAPSERVDGFKIFFDEFKALTDVYADSYDGYELTNLSFEGEKTE